MSTLRAYLGVAGLLDVGYRLYTRNTPLAARSTTDILDEGEGWYSAGSVTLAGDNVRWDSTGTPSVTAREDLGMRIAMETLTGNTSDLWATALPGSYTTGQAGNIIGRFNLTPTTTPLGVIVAPSTNLQLSGYLYTFDAQGNPKPYVTLTFQLVVAPTDLNESDSTVPFNVQSNSVGLLTVFFRKTATYTGRRGRTGSTATFLVPATADSNGGFALPDILGK